MTSGPYAGAPSFTIYQDGTLYKAKNQYGAISSSSADAATIINAAELLLPFNGVFSVKGNITLTSEIILKDHSVLDLTEGSLIQSSTFSSNHIIVGGSYDTIIGGIIDGRNYEPSYAGISFVAKHDSKVSGVEITNVHGGGIGASSGAYNMNFENNYIHDIPVDSRTSLSYGIVIETNEVGNCYDNYVQGNTVSNVHGNCISIVSDVPYVYGHFREHILNNKLSNSGTLDGIQLYFNVFDSEVSGNIISDAARLGIKVDGSSYNTISQNIIKQVSLAGTWGIEITSRRYNLSYSYIASRYNTVIGNIINLPGGLAAINIQGTGSNESDHNRIIENSCYYNNWDSRNGGLIFLSFASYTEVQGNYVYHSRNNGIIISDSMWCKVDGNTIDHFASDPYTQQNAIRFSGAVAAFEHFATCSNNKIIVESLGNSTDNGIEIDGNYVTAQNNYLIDWNNPLQINYAISEGTSSNYNIINYNTIFTRGSGLATPINKVGVYTIVGNNTLGGNWVTP